MSDDKRPAFEAEAEAEGQRPKAEGQKAEAITTTLAASPKAAVRLAEAEAVRIRLEAATAAQDAKATREAKTDLARVEAQIAKAEAKANRKAEAAAQRRAVRASAASKAGLLLTKIRSESAASYSAFVYAVVVSVAVWSQQQIFKDKFEWEDVPATGAAIFVELTGLAFYATSVAMRLDGRSGVIPRLIAWAVTGFAAFMQFKAHEDVQVGGVPLLSIALASASVAALLLAEIRTSHKVGKRLEDMDQKDRPQARLGLRFFLRYPAQAWWAVSAMIAIPGIRTRSAALRAGRLMRTLRARRDFNEALMRDARSALKAATKAGANEAVLLRLGEYAYFGLEAIGLQAQITSAPAAFEANEAAQPLKAEATVEPPRPRPTVTRPAVRSVAQRPAQERPKAIEPKAEAKQPTQEDNEGRPDEQWAIRPGKNPFVWEQRLAVLAAHFPGDADAVPARQPCIDYFRQLKESGQEVPFAWTNKEHVGYALGDLKALRSAGFPDPQVQQDENSETTL